MVFEEEKEFFLGNGGFWFDQKFVKNRINTNWYKHLIGLDGYSPHLMNKIKLNDKQSNNSRTLHWLF